MLAAFAALAIILALVDPQPLADYRHWLRVPTLAGLLGLLIAIQGIRDSGLIQRLAAMLAARMHSMRSLGLLLICITAILSMVLTNDVSLFLLVPLTITLAGICKLPLMRMVILEALAVNAGSALSPIGNPQNLLLWQHAGISFMAFVWTMLPVVMVMLGLVLILTWFWLPRGRVDLDHSKIERNSISVSLAALSMLALLAMILLMEAGHAVWGALLLALSFALLRRRTLLEIDWLLLATFAVIFLGLGHFAELPLVQHALERLDFTHPLTIYIGGIVAAQLISNVPATVLLLDRVPDTMALAVAVNVGGYGAAVGSLANLIALRLARQPNSLHQLHRVSVPFLLICAPLVYLVMRWLA